MPDRLKNAVEILDFIGENPSVGQGDIVRKFGCNHESASLAILIVSHGTPIDHSDVREGRLSISTVGRRVRARNRGDDVDTDIRRRREQERTVIYQGFVKSVEGLLGLPAASNVAPIIRARARQFTPDKIDAAIKYLKEVRSEFG